MHAMSTAVRRDNIIKADDDRFIGCLEADIAPRWGGKGSLMEARLPVPPPT